MLHIIRTIIEPFISKNLIIFNFVSKIRYYLGYPRYLFSLKFKKEYIGGYLLSDQEAGRNRQIQIKKIIKQIDKKFVKVLEILNNHQSSSLVYIVYVFPSHRYFLQS